MSEIVLTLISRRECHLCDEMKAVVGEVAAGESIRVEVRDVDEDRDLARLYGDQVPVLLVNGRKAFKYRVTPDQLRRRIGAQARGVSVWWKRWGRHSR